MQDEGYEPQGQGAPPTYYEPMMPEQRSSWPTVIGVISIVLGSLGILFYGCCGTIGSILGPAMIGMAPPGEIDAVTTAQMDVVKQYMAFSVAANVIASCLAVVLLIAGIGLLRRRNWSAKAHIGWAIARLVFAIPHSGLSYVMNRDMWAAMEKAAAESGDPVPAGLAALMASAGIIGVIITFAIAATWPVFILIWFSRAKIKDEVAMWAAEARARI